MSDEKSGSTPNTKNQPVEEKEPVKVNLSEYRSMILTKLRTDIEAKHALYESAKTADLSALKDMSYWKMAYWKMAYWKMGGGRLMQKAFEE
jgi:hypothetical protein